MDTNENKVKFILNVVQMCSLAYMLSEKKKRRYLVRPLSQERKNKGFYETTFKIMKEHDPDLFFNSTRMSKDQYELLVNLLTDPLTKRSFREPISPECRLVITITYLSQGVTIQYLASSFRVGTSTVRNIIQEVCTVLWDVLSPVYTPRLNARNWKTISKQFNDRWNMPNCVGSIGGRHINIKCRSNTESKYMNHMGYTSIVLMATCDANYTFTTIDVGDYGSQAEGVILRNSVVGKQIFDNEIDLPPVDKLPNSVKSVPYYFVGDTNFPLRTNLMRAYPKKKQQYPEEVFNFRLSRANEVIENTFGILTARWRILGKRIDMHPKHAEKVVLACAILHNFLKITDSEFNCNSYCPQDYCDSYTADGERIDGTWRQEAITLLPVRKCGSNYGPDEAFQIRKILTNYFLNEGKVSFQPKQE